MAKAGMDGAEEVPLPSSSTQLLAAAPCVLRSIPVRIWFRLNAKCQEPDVPALTRFKCSNTAVQMQSQPHLASLYMPHCKQTSSNIYFTVLKQLSVRDFDLAISREIVSALWHSL